MVTNLTNQQIEEIVDKVIKKVWERVLTFGVVLIAAFILVSLELNKAKAEESITPTEFKDAIVAVPGKVSSFAQSEWQKTKEYQTESWAEMRAQFISTKDQIISLFTKN